MGTPVHEVGRALTHLCHEKCIQFAVEDVDSAMERFSSIGHIREPLTANERSILAGLRAPKRRAEWLAGRRAAKRVVCGLLLEDDVRSVEVGRDGAGAPAVTGHADIAVSNLALVRRCSGRGCALPRRNRRGVRRASSRVPLERSAQPRRTVRIARSTEPRWAQRGKSPLDVQGSRVEGRRMGKHKELKTIDCVARPRPYRRQSHLSWVVACSGVHHHVGARTFDWGPSWMKQAPVSSTALSWTNY